ncbi:hypothetical protein [Halegenticoccus tardaugens]|uniref:hypothetical protein n=1 Tax=Halegenticoccus tardaugens TaxID=2071624 RepID=UPI00100B453F|nr:hypothetical protein [Halegenticoccus tardaugens]
MTDEREELLRQLNEKQAVHGVDPETRALIGLLSATVLTLGEEIDDLRQRIEKLESTDEEQRKRAWYSER